MDFKLHSALEKKDYICDLPFCKVLFEDNQNYPWIFLVPRKNNVRNMLDLTHEERINLMNEIELCEKIMNDLFTPDQTNVAMIGNMTPQLHVHIICRRQTDKAWPGVVWGEETVPYPTEKKQQLIKTIKERILSCQK